MLTLNRATSRRAGAALLVQIMLLTLTAGTVSAAFIAPQDYSMWTRGDAETTYQFWDGFQNPLPDGPDVDQNANGVATTTTTGGMVIGSASLYSPGGPQTLDITIPDFNQAGTTSVLLQVKTTGSELDPASLSFGGTLGYAYTHEISRITEASGFGPVQTVETLFTFHGLPTSSVFGINFDAPIHSSVQNIAVDTNFVPVPEPGTATLFGLGLAGLAASSRKRASPSSGTPVRR